jgi:hypothetical protein
MVSNQCLSVEYPPLIYTRVNDEADKIQRSPSTILKTAKPQLRKVILKNCSNELAKSISECVLNVLHDNLKLSACQKKRLRKFKVPLRALADKRVSISAKKRLLN